MNGTNHILTANASSVNMFKKQNRYLMRLDNTNIYIMRLDNTKIYFMRIVNTESP